MKLKIKAVFIFVSVLLFLSNTPCFAQNFEIKSNNESGYTLYIDNKPFLVKGVGYNPTPIGEGYKHDFFADPSKPWLVDGKLMKEAGINCVRIYTAGQNLDQVRQFIRDMYTKFGIYTAMSDWLGLWDYPRANYADASFQNETKQRILKLVKALKDEKGLLMWILGNENNYTFSGKIGFWTSPEIEKNKDLCKKQSMRAKIYYSFIDELAKEIKKIDPSHPVVLGNGEATFLEVAAGICKNVDMLGIIIYRGKRFGNIFNNIRNIFDKPIVLTEFGCDSYDAFKEEENQEVQAEFILSQWKDLYSNTTAIAKSGNALGGFIFEWNDEWWKHNEGYAEDWKRHNTDAGWSHGAYYYDVRAKNNLNMNEEWFGLVSLSEDIDNGINKRIPKKSFYTLKDFFANPKAYLAKE